MRSSNIEVIFFTIFSLPVLVAGFEPLIVGFCVKCSTTEKHSSFWYSAAVKPM